MSEETTRPQAFIMRCASGQWMYEIWINGQDVSYGFGYADMFDAYEMAQENNPHLEDMQMVIRKE